MCLPRIYYYHALPRMRTFAEYLIALPKETSVISLASWLVQAYTVFSHSMACSAPAISAQVFNKSRARPNQGLT
jgi:hypothetical protein